MTSGQEHPHKHLRLYLIMSTLVVGAILVLLFINDSDGFNLTSAIIGVSANDSQDDESGVSSTSRRSLADEEEIFSRKVGKSDHEVDISLTFDQIPSVKKEASIKEMELRFDDLTTTINVNNDRLELNNLDEVTLKIRDFSGMIDFDDSGFSLNGKAKVIEVNEIALASKGEMEISFQNLNYDYLGLEDLALKEMQLPTGDGELKVSEKLSYSLEQDKLTIYFFNGKLLADRDADTLLNLEGVAKGLSVSGALVDLSLS